MRTNIAVGVLTLGLMCHASAAWAADYWVAPNGSDSSAGTQSAPWATIQHAADTMQPGDSVTVGDGSYAGFWMKNRQGDAQHRFTFRAQNALGAKITGPSPTASDPNDSVQLVSVSFATIDGFDVTGAPRAGILIRTFGDDTGADTTDNVVQNCRSHDNGAGVTAGRHDGIFTGFAQNVVVQNNEVDHNSEHGIYVSNSADNPVIRGNRSHDNKANGIQINGDASTGGDGVISSWLIENNIVAANGGASAINLDGATFGALRNNLVYGNARGGIALFMGDSAEASHDNVVVDNTVFDPQGSRFAIQIDNGADNNVVFDNVFWSASSGMEIGTVNGLVHDYNVVSSYVGGSAGAHESTPDVSLLFVSASNDDYRPGPALIGQGTGTLSGVSVPPLDLHGNARPQDGTFDIGCLEHVSGGGGPEPSAGDDAGSALSTPMAEAGGATTTDAASTTTTEAGGVATTDAASAAAEAGKAGMMRPPQETDAAAADAASAESGSTSGALGSAGKSEDGGGSTPPTGRATGADSTDNHGCSVPLIPGRSLVRPSLRAKTAGSIRGLLLIFFVMAALVRLLRTQRGNYSGNYNDSSGAKRERDD
jgi:parallel beta-helix repeat protein